MNATTLRDETIDAIALLADEDESSALEYIEALDDLDGIAVRRELEAEGIILGHVGVESDAAEWLLASSVVRRIHVVGHVALRCSAANAARRLNAPSESSEMAAQGRSEWTWADVVAYVEADPRDGGLGTTILFGAEAAAAS